MVKALNPRAIIHETVNSEVPLKTVLGTGIYDPERASQQDGWLDSLLEHTPETEEYGIASFVYERRLLSIPNDSLIASKKTGPG